MASLITNATIKSRRDTASNWTTNNPTPDAGEWCYETDTGAIKIGDGVTAWTALRYIGDTGVVPAYDSTEATLYETAGYVVEQYGVHYTSSGKTGNLGKDPSNPLNALYWIASPGKDRLIELFNSSRPHFDGMHPSTDYNDANYQQNILLDKIKLGNTTYKFYRVMLDGTVVTGDTTLENTIFDVGGAKEYLWVDKYLPDSAGTRTLIDMRGRVTRAVTATGGLAPTLGEIQEDRMQGHFHGLKNVTNGTYLDRGNVAQASGTQASIWDAQSTQPNRYKAIEPATDGVNGTPRTGLDTRMMNLVRGVDYIIVMIAA